MNSKHPLGSVLVAGGGIAGIQAALDLADSGFYVYMVEQSPAIGGVMAQLDKTFPTNDCSMCIMSPKLVEVGRHINIELVTLASILDIRGEKGDFMVDIFQKARYVDMDKCVGCGACVEKCPKKVDDIYNEGLIKRKAIYVPYAQAVPLKYVIDPENCIKLTRDKCGNCEKVCPADAINYEDTDKTHTINVGSVILAPGFKPFHPQDSLVYGWAASKNVVTSLEFERLLSASGPNQGHIVRMSDHETPKSIAWLQCVGSRDVNQCDNAHCSSVCCMYAIKQAIIAKEHDPALSCTIFYMDMRTHGKGFEACFNEAKDKHDIRFVRCRVHSVNQSLDNPMQTLVYFDDETGELSREEVDIVVLSVGMEIDKKTKTFAEKIGIELTDQGFCKTQSFTPTATSRDGIYVCGAFQGPKDIPQSVIEAGSAALCAGTAVSEARGSLVKTIEEIPERDITGEVPRIGVFVCHCGINISGVVDVPAVRDYAAALPFVEFADDNLYSCSQDAQEIISGIIRDKNLNRVVVAACSPRTHEPLFQETLACAGLNKYLFEMVNIRNHNSWVHKDNPEQATQKAMDSVAMAVSKVALFAPLKEESLSINKGLLVIGGGISGMTSALSMANQGFSVDLVEKENQLGGQARHIFKTSTGADVQEALEIMRCSVMTHTNIQVHLETQLSEVKGFVGNFTTTLTTDSGETVVEHGAAIIATGAAEYKPDEYMYKKDPRVMTGLELDNGIMQENPGIMTAKTAVFIQCVGSRQPERPYCSRICCTHSITSALHLKQINPKMDVYVLYRDIRTYGEKELLYQEAREKGVIFIRYDQNNKPMVTKGDKHLDIVVTDHILKSPVLIKTDLLVLASAVVSRRDDALAQMFKVPMDSDGFFAEAHVKLAPSNFAVDGVFLCGLAHYPKPIDESIAQAQAAAAGVSRLFAKTQIKTLGNTAAVDTTICSSCGVCIEVCPYNAPFFIEEGRDQGKAAVNSVLCKGCGVCVASCRSGASGLKGFEEEQIMAMIDHAF
ncbi:FAD-dependent oxidoreductase [Desulfobacula toluolica]|uniref:HdlA8: heterodisulfide reductase-like protein, iron-sulfur subunit n=1 Tax=Desulfobacula toluolica (strain DSM 7467 / Tol2) TaxID=651182 RepID=K0NI51_DESTT|nr:FAD-dependent oxidoreductase [Desulfobacula toluolica]CCK81036.1 HdlA8: heterodisulfide reductase-like protein, iron-sulfur subunit [Desulfobacula toluolica Tol2]